MSSQTPLALSIAGVPLCAEAHLSVEDLAAAAGLSPGRLARLVRLGLVEPLAPRAIESGQPLVFTAATALRLRRMLRLRADLGVSLMGAAIIVDLLERLDRAETQVAALRGRP